jgi:membrane-associated phospholipid phosphatase
VTRLISVALVLFTVSCATAERYGRAAVADVRAVATAPARADWKKVGLSAAAVGAALLIDDEVARIARANTSSGADRIADAIEPFGGGHSDKVMAAFLAYGLIRRDERAKAVAFDAFMSSLIASKGITPALKKITNRERPNGGDQAFPSNHATQAFLLATTIAEHYDRRWVRNLAYGVAAGVAAARIYHDDHWTSDVVAGALIGTAVAKIVVRTNNAERARWGVSATPQGVAITFSTDASALCRGRCGGSIRRGRSGVGP